MCYIFTIGSAAETAQTVEQKRNEESTMGTGDSIGGRTRLCGLIGNPVEHTLSPLIHNTLAQSCGRDMVYVPFFVEDGRLGDAVKGAYALNVLGLNITVPVQDGCGSVFGKHRTDGRGNRFGQYARAVRRRIPRL